MKESVSFKSALIVSILGHGVLFSLMFFSSTHPTHRNVGTVLNIKTRLVASRDLFRHKTVVSNSENIQEKALSKQMKNISVTEFRRVKRSWDPPEESRAFREKRARPSIEKLGHFDALMILLHNRISENQHYPRAALLLGQQGDIEVGFSLSPDGQIKNIRLLTSSHYAMLDRAALNAVDAVGRVLEARQYINRETSLRVWVRFRIANT